MDKLVANLMVLRTVIELKNFSLAADYLDISQSSVSRKIEELEQELGVELIRRNTRELEIKAIAFAICRQFIIDARHVLGVINTLQLSANHLSGKITAVFPQTFANIYITPYLAEFNRRYPYIQLNIHYHDIAADALQEYFEIAVFNQKIDNTIFTSEYLCNSSGSLYCTQHYRNKYGVPHSIADLSQHLVAGIAEFSYQDCNGRLSILDARGEAIGMLPLNELQIVTNESLYSLAVASSGQAIACVCDEVIQHHSLASIFEKVLPEYSFGKTNYYLTTIRGNLLPVQQVFLDFIKQRINTLN